MRSISTFLGVRQHPSQSSRQSFCNYLHSEIENLEERDFLTFRNETVKLLSAIQYKAEERKRLVIKSQEVTIFQLPEASQTTAGLEYILAIPETQPVSIPVVQPTQTATGELLTVIAKVQQPPRPSSVSAQPTSCVVVDDQQPGTSRQMIFNPPVPSPQEESQHNTSGLSSLFGAIPSVLQYQQMDTPQPFSPSQLQPAPSPVQSSTNHEQSRPPSQSSQHSQPKSATCTLTDKQTFFFILLFKLFFSKNKHSDACIYLPLYKLDVPKIVEYKFSCEMEAHVEVTTSLMLDCNTFKDKRHLLTLVAITLPSKELQFCNFIMQ